MRHIGQSRASANSGCQPGVAEVVLSGCYGPYEIARQGIALKVPPTHEFLLSSRPLEAKHDRVRHAALLQHLARLEIFQNFSGDQGAFIGPVMTLPASNPEHWISSDRVQSPFCLAPYLLVLFLSHWLPSDLPRKAGAVFRRALQPCQDAVSILSTGAWLRASFFRLR
jgi:hypothetical protein